MDALIGLAFREPCMLEYSGRTCSHRCMYCYARASGKRESGWHKTQNFLRNFHRQKNLAAELFKRELPICFSNQTDPFCETGWRESVSILNLLSQFRNGLFILTKTGSGMDEALDAIGNKENIVWYITITCADDELSKRIEPGAPPTSKRLEIAFDLAAKGFMVIVTKIESTLTEQGTKH